MGKSNGRLNHNTANFWALEAQATSQASALTISQSQCQAHAPEPVNRKITKTNLTERKKTQRKSTHTLEIEKQRGLLTKTKKEKENTKHKRETYRRKLKLLRINLG